jgi:hypothetical protein
MAQLQPPTTNRAFSDWLVGLKFPYGAFRQQLLAWKKGNQVISPEGLAKGARYDFSIAPEALSAMLSHSLFFPVCGTDDFQPLRLAASGVLSFIYADPAHDAEERIRALEQFLKTESGMGFEIARIVALHPDQLRPRSNRGNDPAGAAEAQCPCGATLVLLQSAIDVDAARKRVCVLLLDQKATDAYRCLFLQWKIGPSILAVVAAGVGSDFQSPVGDLARMVQNNESGLPRFFLEDRTEGDCQWHPHYSVPGHRAKPISAFLRLWVPVG